jgi:hypothetical protein
VASQAPGSRAPATLGPLLLLLGYGLAFAAAALGVTPIAFDDHPGQLYRAWHVVTLGPAPWAWNSGWWMGYPELQFYPPMFAYLVALLHWISLGVLTVPAAYHALLWLAYLAPGVTAWLALRAALGHGGLALPGAFVALTLSLWPALLSGVEGGVRVGMAPARLGWALLPLLAAALMRWSDGAGLFPARAVVPLVAAVVLTHPAHLPAALALVALAALATAPRLRRLAVATGWLVLAALVTAFWTLPLIARLEHTRALAWGALTPIGLRDTLLAHPLVLALVLLSVAALAAARRGRARLLARWPLAMAVIVAVDALALERLGLAWLPADRVMDGFWLALVLAGGVGAGLLLARLAARRSLALGALGAAAVAASVALSLAGSDTLALWPRPAAWPGYAATERGLRLPALWTALRATPEGRVLFVRSGVPLAFGTEWWRPHTHVTALAPLAAGRAIVNGTFTHPSPVAAFVYRGRADGGAITTLVERLDGESLFGRPLETLDATTLERHARRLGISTIVALDEDLPRLAALADHPAFAVRRREPPFVIWSGPRVMLPQPVGPGRWRVPLERTAGDWTSVPVAYYPLWQATTLGRAVETRRGEYGDLEVRAPAGATALELTYAPATAEQAGLALSALGVIAWAVLWLRSRTARVEPPAAT